MTLPACSAKSLPLKDSGFPRIDQQTPGSPFGLGFFTLAFCQIQAEVLPRIIAKKYPAKVPAKKLTHLTVSKKHQLKGFGKNMMVNALERAMIISRNIGIMGFLWMQRMK